MQRRLRLRHRDDFAHLKQNGETRQHRLCVMSFLENDLPHNRYGFIVVKRIGKAVYRNRIKRIMREATRSLHSQLAVTQSQTGYDIVFIARKPIINASLEDMKHAFSEVLMDANLLDRHPNLQKTVESE